MKRDLEILVALLEDIEERVEVDTYRWWPNQPEDRRNGGHCPQGNAREALRRAR